MMKVYYVPLMILICDNNHHHDQGLLSHECQLQSLDSNLGLELVMTRLALLYGGNDLGLYHIHVDCCSSRAVEILFNIEYIMRQRVLDANGIWTTCPIIIPFDLIL